MKALWYAALTGGQWLVTTVSGLVKFGLRAQKVDQHENRIHDLEQRLAVQEIRTGDMEHVQSEAYGASQAIATSIGAMAGQGVSKQMDR